MNDSNDSPRVVTALLGNYFNTMPLKGGAVTSGAVELDFIDEEVPNRSFKRVVRELDVEVAELAIATLLQAKSLGKPLVLLPASVFGRHQHGCLVFNPQRGPLRPEDLEGRRVGARAYSVTTVMWVRGLLANDYGIDLENIDWVTFEDPHVLEYCDPPHARRAPAGKEIGQMLIDGELDAAILGAPPATDSPLRSMIADPLEAGRAWCARNAAVPVNHLVVVHERLCREAPDVVREVYRMLKESRELAGGGVDGSLDFLPFGLDALRPSLQVAIDYASAQDLLARTLTVDELFDDLTRAL